MSKLICFLADISGSMGTASTNADEGKEYSRLDFVKQSMIFAINAIQPDTLFALVTFESQAMTVIKPIKINESNRDMAIEIVKSLKVNGGTNIMSGLTMCENICRTTDNVTDYNIIMLSDGEDYQLSTDNIEEKMLNCFQIESPIKIDTVGYGPDANTQLLVNIAGRMSGTYSLCFDASMVGTIIGRALVRTYMWKQAFYIPDHIDDNENYKILYHNYRIKLSAILLNINRIRNNNTIALKDLITIIELFIKSNNMDTDRYFNIICSLYSDMVGELTLATSSDIIWHKWGKAYWTTIGIALDKQYAPNFKDACLQYFGTDTIKAEYMRLSDIYSSLPMVNASLSRVQSSTPIYASRFNNASGGCFASSSTLMSADNNILTCDNIIGMIHRDETVIVKGWKDGIDINVIIKTIIISNYDSHKFYKVNNCILTENHPIYIDSKWQHPKDISFSTRIDDEKNGYVFNIILDYGSAIYVDNELCVTLGHNICDESIATDPFWGTERVIQCFNNTFGNQRIIHTRMQNIRDEKTFMTTDLIFNKG